MATLSPSSSSSRLLSFFVLLCFFFRGRRPRLFFGGIRPLSSFSSWSLVLFHVHCIYYFSSFVAALLLLLPTNHNNSKVFYCESFHLDKASTIDIAVACLLCCCCFCSFCCGGLRMLVMSESSWNSLSFRSRPTDASRPACVLCRAGSPRTRLLTTGPCDFGSG